MRANRQSRTMAWAGRVLIVDDHEDTRELYAEQLRFDGFSPVTAADVDAALKRIAAGRPDAVLTDFALPRIDGVELCRVLKGRDDTRAIPILVMTGYDGPMVRSRALDAGATRLLGKPVAPDDLARVIRDAPSASARAPAASLL